MFVPREAVIADLRSNRAVKDGKGIESFCSIIAFCDKLPAKERIFQFNEPKRGITARINLRDMISPYLDEM